MKNYRNCTFRILLGLIAISLLSCSSNILTDFAKTDTEDAKVAEIEELMNKEKFDEALVSFNALSATAQAKRANQVRLAKIYGGQCGLRFLDLSQAITDIGSSRLLLVLMDAFPGATAAHVTACINAEATILGIDQDGAQRETQENMLMAYISWAKMGVILSQYADTNDDGAADGGFDACDVGDLPQVEAQHVAAGLANMVDGLGNIGGSSVGGGQLSAINALCTALQGVNASYNFCTAKIAASVNANQEKGVRSLVQEASSVGLGSNGCTGDVSSGIPCVCL